MTHPNEHEDLDALLKSQGWLRFAQHAESEWIAKLEDKLKMAVSDTDDAQALAKLRQVMVAKDAIQRLLRWPHDRLAQIQQASENRERAEAIPLSRRGRL